MRLNPTIAIVLPDLRPGGAERLHVELARHWESKGISTTFVLRAERGELLRTLPEYAEVHCLEAPRVRNAVRPLVAYLREKTPSALLAAMWPLTVIAPFSARIAGYRGNVVVSEHAPQSLSYAESGRVHNMVMAASMRMFYPAAHSRVAVSSGVAEDMAQLSSMSRDKFSVIHNPAALGRLVPRGDSSWATGKNEGPLILSVGTLKAVKRHDVLIRAFSLMKDSSATLCILGEGVERKGLEALIAELGLRDRVLLPGYQVDTTVWYASADLFVLSSDYEGFGNVIVEALEQGTPVVSTDCPSGPREILANGRYGTLVPLGDVQALAEAMAESLSRKPDREALMDRARDFSVDKAADAYLDLLLPGWRGNER